MQISSVSANPNFNGVKFKSFEDLSLLNRFNKNNRLDPKFKQICNEQLNNPVNINIEADSKSKNLLFKVGKMIFKSNFFRSNIETLEVAAKYANQLNPEKVRLMEYIA